ncbi:AAA family ATPase [Hamadaea tsunoensis]|uniref:AAA family ATPase n=1 Tax=Hamadaea tsunoensis TaxID=53368 RepID=UPI00040EB1FC|nr:LuxR family transcriptional regulator [Hamadaea tsunoensis]
MDLVERSEPLAVLESAARRTLGGRGQINVVGGPPGVGKTAMLQALTEAMEVRDAAVAHAACAPAERHLAWGVVHQLVAAPAFPVDLADRAEKLLGDGDGTDALPRLCADVLRVSRQRPLLLTVDDIQYADTASLRFLLHLARRTRNLRVQLALTTSVEPTADTEPFLAELRRQPHFRCLGLSPLSDRGAAELVSRRLDRAEALGAEEILRAGGGNPRLLEALLDDYAQTGLPGLAYRQALIGCVLRAEDDAARVARALAVLGEDARAADVAAVLDHEPAAVRAALETLAAARIFEHPAARAAILEDLGEQRAQLHARAAEVLYANGSPASTVAGHLLATGPLPVRWAAGVLGEAAEQALAEDRTAVAARMLSLAIQCPAEPAELARARAALTDLLWQENPASTGEHLTELISAARAGHLPRPEEIQLVRRLLWLGRAAEAATVLQRLRSAAAGSGDPEAEVHDLEQWLTLSHPPLARPAGLRGPDDADARLVAPRVDPWLRACASIAASLVRGRLTEAAATAERTLHDLLLGRHTGWAEESVLTAMLALTRADRVEAAASWHARLSATTDRGPTWQAVLAAARSEIALARGDLAGVVQAAEEALTLPVKGWGIAAGLPLGDLVVATSRLGRWEQAATHLAVAVPDALHDSRYALHYLYARGHHQLATRHHHAALSDFLACGELSRRWGLEPAALVAWRAGAAEAWLRLGNRDQARLLLRDQLARPGAAGGRTRAVSLRLLAACDTGVRRPQLLAEALELLESCGDRFEQARTLTDLAKAHHGLGDNRRARTVFRRALHMAQLCEAEPLRRELLAITSELGELAQPDADTGLLATLTGSEQRVAALAAMGYTNREIAARLYVTASTVEQHLTRVYRKLNVKHRRELPVDLSRLVSSA